MPDITPPKSCIIQITEITNIIFLIPPNSGEVIFYILLSHSFFYFNCQYGASGGSRTLRRWQAAGVPNFTDPFRAPAPPGASVSRASLALRPPEPSRAERPVTVSIIQKLGTDILDLSNKLEFRRRPPLRPAWRRRHPAPPPRGVSARFAGRILNR